MLKSKPRTAVEAAQYLEELKRWMGEERDTPAEEMVDFFSKRLPIYEEVHLSRWGEEYSHIADYFREGLGSLLDIGCGTGLELEAIFRRFPQVQVTGIDLNAEMLQKLQEKYRKKVELITADYFVYPLGTETYDAALSVETLHHFPYQKKQQIYDKLCAAIKPGGYYVECDYMACCEEEERLCLEYYDYKRKNSRLAEDVFLHVDIPLTLSHQLELMKRAGFQRIEVLYQKESTVILRAEKE